MLNSCLAAATVYTLLTLLPTHPAYPQSSPVIDSSTLTLRVLDSIWMALDNNRSLAVERYGPDIVRTFVEEEKAVFDPLLASQASAAESKGQRTSGVGEFRGVSNRSKDVALGVSKLTPVGVEVDLSATMNTRESNVYTRLYSTRIGASLNVPILEGLGSEVNLVGVRLAERDVELSVYELKGFILALVSQVEEIYWDLISAREELNILVSSLDLAHQQLEETKDRIEVGSTAEIELAAAEGEVALREEAVIDARSAVETYRLRLLHLLNPPVDRLWDTAIDPIDSPILEHVNAGPLEDHLAAAFDLRPDLNQARIQMEKNELEIVRTRNGLLPRLDFFITLGKTGYAETFGDSVNSIVDDENFDLNTGLVFQYRFGRRAERSRYKRSEIRQQEAQAAFDNFQQLVELDVRTAYIELNRSMLQIQATRSATSLQEGKYLAELEKFRVGKSTNLLVLAAQRDLIRSQLDELRAQINTRKALVRLRRASATLLDHHQIVLPSVP